MRPRLPNVVEDGSLNLRKARTSQLQNMMNKAEAAKAAAAAEVAASSLVSTKGDPAAGK